MRVKVGSEAVSRWLDPLSVSSATERAVVLEAPNPFFRDWVVSHYLEAIRPYAVGRDVQVVTIPASPASFEVAAKDPEPLPPQA